MFTKIKLSIIKELNLELIENGIESYLYRLIAKIKIINSTESFLEQAIVDTGSPITILPYSIWKDQNVVFLKHRNKKLFGFGKSRIEGRLTNINIVFADDKSISPVLKIKAYLIKDDSIPLIIGMEDIIDKVNLVIDGKRGKCYIEY